MNLSHSQVTDKNQLIKDTFNYIEGQKFTLNLVQKNFPELSLEAGLAEMEFNKSYSVAIYQINNEMKKLMGGKFDTYLNSQHKEFSKAMEHKKLSLQVARKLIKNANARAQGHIQTPIIETLLSYQYHHNPVEEIKEGFFKTHQVISTTNGKKLHIKIDIPVSWRDMDENSTKVLKMFRNKYGLGNETIELIYRELITQENENKLKPNFYSIQELKDMYRGNHLIEINNIRNKNQVAYAEYLDNTEAKNYVMESLFFMDQHLIRFRLISSKYNENNEGEVRQKYKSLYERIKASIVLGKKEKKFVSFKI